MYFYAQHAGIPPAEGNVTGQHVYRTVLTNMLDLRSPPGQALIKAAPRTNGAIDRNAFERSIIDAGFDGYVDAEGSMRDMAVVLGSHVEVEYLGTRQEAALSRGTGRGLKVDRVRSYASDIMQSWRNAPGLEVVQSVEDLPFDAPDDAEGAYWRGTVYLVGDNLSSDLDIERTLFHEARGHYGLRGLLGDRIIPALTQIANRNQNIRAAAAKWKTNNARGKNQSQAAYNALAIEEAMSNLAGTGQTFTGFKQFLAKLQEALRAVGLNKLADWLESATDAQALELLAQARTFVEQGADAQTGALAPAMSTPSIWRSQLREALMAKAPYDKKGSIDSGQLTKWLEARAKDGTVKPDEVEWTGIKEWLATQPRVTREQVEEFIDQNGVRVTEKMLGEMPEDGWRDEAGDLIRDGSRSTKFASYQLPGGTNYKELLLTLPAGSDKVGAKFQAGFEDGSWGVFERDRWEMVERAANQREATDRAIAYNAMNPNTPLPQTNFYSSHFGQPNILAHIRFNERTDADGKRVLFLEEIQSDAAQGKRKGSVTWGAPFIDKTEAWVALSLKRMIRYAVDHSTVGSPAYVAATEPESIGKLVDNFGGRELFANAPLSVVQASMLPMLKHDQVRVAVIEAIPVDVVNILAGNSLSPKQLVSDPDVVSKTLPANLRASVSRGFGSALEQVRARLRAALDSGLPTGRDFKLLPTLSASDLNAREIVWLLSPFTLSNTSADSRGSGGAFVPAKSSVSSAALDVTRVSNELAPADLAIALNRHEAISSRNPRNPIKSFQEPQGFQALAWTTGEQQADRYSLAKQISEVRVELLSNGRYNIKADGLNGERVIAPTSYKAEELPDVIGKELAERAVAELDRKAKEPPPAKLTELPPGYQVIVDQARIARGQHGYGIIPPGQDHARPINGTYYATAQQAKAGALEWLNAREEAKREATGNTVVYSGLDLKIGGEGMRGFYDSIVPAVANKVLKSLGGGKVGTVSVNGGPVPAQKVEWGDEYERAKNPERFKPEELQQPGFDITDAMKAKAQEGMPLFARPKLATASAAFKKWFGDSKVVDKDGKPLVVYHGTENAGFAVFDESRSGEGAGRQITGFYFTNHIAGAQTYSGTREDAVIDEEARERGNYAVYLSLQNPLVVDFEGHGWDGSSPDGEYNDDFNIDRIARDAKEQGYDGVIATNIMDEGRYGEGYGWGDTTYVAFRPEQIKSATGNSGAFDPANPDIRFSRRQSAPPPARFAQLPANVQDSLRKVGIGVNGTPLKQRIAELLTDWQMKLQQGLLDQFASLKDLDKHAYMLARLTKAAHAPLEALLHFGKPFLNDAGAADFRAEAGGLVGQLRPLVGKEVDLFLAWIAGNRAAQLKAEGRENLLTDDDITNLRDLNQGVMEDGRPRPAAYAAAHAKLNEYSKSVLDFAEKAGILEPTHYQVVDAQGQVIGDYPTDAQARAAAPAGATVQVRGRALWERDFYVPFYRIAEDSTEIRGPKVAMTGIVNQYAFKKLKGGRQEINDLFQNTLRNWAHLLDASLKNQAATEALVAATYAGIARPIPETMAGKGDPFVLVNGEKQFFQVDDPLIMQALSALEKSPFTGAIPKLMGKFKFALTLGVTASPAFRVRNLIRDSVQALAANPVSYNIGKNLVEGWNGTKTSDPMYQKALVGGAFMHFGSGIEGDLAHMTKRLIDGGVAATSILNTEAKVLDAFKSAWQWWEDTGTRVENVTRAAIYKQNYERAINEGRTEAEAHLLASYAARDSMDFSSQGAWPAVRFLSQVVPFMNARLQGMYKLGREGLAPTVRAGMALAKGLPIAPEDKARAVRFNAVVAATAMASIALLLAYRDDEDWQRREEWDRDNFWWFKFGDKAYRIPKPFEVGALASVAERGVEAIMDGLGPVERTRFAKRMMALLSDNLSMSFIPQMFKPPLDIYANKDSFTGRPIETAGMESLSPSERATARTSQIAKGLGKAGVLSPVQIDHLIRGYFGWLGAHIVMTTDYALRPMTGAPTSPESRIDEFTTAIGMRGFVSSLPADQSRFITDFYDQAQKVQQVMADVRHYQKLGDTKKAKDILEDNKDAIRLYPSYRAAVSAMTKVNAEIKKVEASSLPADAKRTRLDKLRQARGQIAERVETMRKKLEVQL